MSVRHIRLATLALFFCLFTSLRPAAFAEEVVQPRTDASGDPLPAGALARLGTTRFRPGDDILASSLSPDGKLLAIALGNGRHISLMDARTGKLLHRYRAEPDGARRLTFSPDGKSLAAISGWGDLIVIYEAKTGEIRGEIKRDEHADEPDVVFSADGNRVTAGCKTYHPHLSLKVWDAKTMKQIASCPSLHNDEVRVALSADGKVLASWGESIGAQRKGPEERETIQLWDLESGKELRRLEVGKHVFSAAFSPDGKHLAVTAADPPVLLVWDVSTGRRVRQVAMEAYNEGVLRYSPDGKRLAAATRIGDIYVWESASGKRLSFHHEPRCHFTSIAFRDGEFLVAGVVERSVFLWGGREGRTLTPQSGHTGHVRGIGFSRDGSRVTTSGPDGVRLWETNDGKLLRHVIVPAGTEDNMLYQEGRFLSPDGKYLVASKGPTDRIRVMEVASGKVVCELAKYNTHSIVPVAFAADGATLAVFGSISAGKERSDVLRVWDLSKGQAVRTLKVPPGDYHNVAISPDGGTVAVMTASFSKRNRPDACQVHLWDVSSGRKLCSFTSNGIVSSLAFASDSDLLTTGGGPDGRIVLRSRISGKRLRPLQGEKEKSAYGVLFSPDGRTLAAASNGPPSWKSHVVVWELASGAIRAEFRGQGGEAVTAMAFSPDGRILATGGDDTTVLLWDVTGRSSSAALAKDKPSARELAALWSDLDNRDARKAHQAMIRLTAAPAEAVALFRKNLAPAAPALTAKERERLIADLDSDSFAARENARRQLEKVGEEAQSALTAALKNKPGLEKRRRLEALLDIVGSGRPAWELVRPLRAVEVLERLATPQARQLLETLSQGAAESRLTRDARSALRRLSREP